MSKVLGTGFPLRFNSYRASSPATAGHLYASSIGEPLSLKEAGITEQQMSKGIDTLVRLGSSDTNMGTISCECKEENLRQLFQDMWEGKR